MCVYHTVVCFKPWLTLWGATVAFDVASGSSVSLLSSALRMACCLRLPPLWSPVLILLPGSPPTYKSRLPFGICPKPSSPLSPLICPLSILMPQLRCHELTGKPFLTPVPMRSASLVDTSLPPHSSSLGDHSTLLTKSCLPRQTEILQGRVHSFSLIAAVSPA